VYGWQVKLCDPLVTNGPYPSTLEIKGKYLVTNMWSTLPGSVNFAKTRAPITSKA